MRKLLAVTMGFMVSILFAAGAGAATTITDTEGTPGAYYGGIFDSTPPGVPDPTYAHDIIPQAAHDQWGVDTLQAGPYPVPGFIQVVLTGPYFNTDSATGVGGPLPKPAFDGDLYISSTGWFVATNPPALGGHGIGDTFNQSTEHWDYVVKYMPNAAGFNSAIYAFNQALPYDPILHPNGYIPTGNGGVHDLHDFFRDAQAWRGGYNGAALGAARVVLDPDAQTLTFIFPDLGGILNPDIIGYHWTQDCGNDVVEGGGGTPVPEPGILLLLGLGIAGLAVYRRRAHHQ